MLKVALAAEDAAGVQALRMLADRGHVATTVLAGEGSVSQSVVGDEAESRGIPLLPAAAVREPDTARVLVEDQIDLLLSVHCRHAIHSDLLAVPRLGAFNLHPGPLPERAGLHPPSWALYEGATEHGVTLHHMTPALDAGPIVFEDRFPVQSDDNGLSVLTQCVRRGIQLLGHLLDILEAGKPVPARTQDPAARRWFGARPPHDGRLDWSMSGTQVVNLVRACDYRPFASPWGSPRCSANGQEVSILEARVGGPFAAPTRPVPGTVRLAPDGGLVVAAGNQWVEVLEVGIAGDELPAVEVLRDGQRLVDNPRRVDGSLSETTGV